MQLTGISTRGGFWRHWSEFDYRILSASQTWSPTRSAVVECSHPEQISRAPLLEEKVTQKGAITLARSRILKAPLAGVFERNYSYHTQCTSPSSFLGKLRKIGKLIIFLSKFLHFGHFWSIWPKKCPICARALFDTGTKLHLNTYTHTGLTMLDVLPLSYHDRGGSVVIHLAKVRFTGHGPLCR